MSDLPVLDVAAGLRLPTAAAYVDLCHYCTSVATTRDHIVPRRLGGSNAQWNIVPACKTCNSKKRVNFPTCAGPVCTESVRRHLSCESTRAYILAELAERKTRAEQSALNALAQHHRSAHRAERIAAAIERVLELDAFPRPRPALACAGGDER